jgi:peptidylprolyl isomerase
MYTDRCDPGDQSFNTTELNGAVVRSGRLRVRISGGRIEEYRFGAPGIPRKSSLVLFADGRCNKAGIPLNSPNNRIVGRFRQKSEVLLNKIEIIGDFFVDVLVSIGSYEREISFLIRNSGGLMTQAKTGDMVSVHYTGKLKDGTVFDTSEGKQPFQFKIGEQSVIPGFEKGVVGLEVGESKTVEVPPDEGYGPWRKELALDVNKSEFPPNITPEVGKQLQMEQKDGRKVNVMITNVESDMVTLDANHPLAGKTLVFDIELVSISE